MNDMRKLMESLDEIREEQNIDSHEQYVPFLAGYHAALKDTKSRGFLKNARAAFKTWAEDNGYL